MLIYSEFYANQHIQYIKQANLNIFQQSIYSSITQLVMKKKDQALDPLLKRVSISLDKCPQEIQPFFKILKDNWYDSEQSLKKLSISDYEKMKIPHRVAQTINQLLNNSSANNQKKHQQNTTQAKLQLNQKTMTAITNNLNHKLMLNLHQNRYQVRSILQIIYKLISNILKDPYEIKYRSLKKSNNLIQKNIMQQQPCLQFMTTIGFEDNDDTLELNKFDVPQLVFLEDCLNQTIVHLGGTDQQKNKNSNKQQQQMFLNVTKFPTSATQSQVQEQFSQEKLSQMKYVDALQKLIQVRNKIMSQPPKDRRLRIYHKKYETKQAHVGQISFEEQFQRTDDKVIAGYWKQIIANNSKSQKFQSKRKLQFDYLIKQKIYKQTLIKIKLPNQLIIQAYFGPLQKLDTVFKYVANIVIGNLYLFTAPPKKVMDKKQMDKTLIQLEAVPMGSFYLSATDDVFYIQQQFVQIIQK